MIDILKYLVLGIIQGFCEIIPVSSSAHLIIFEKILNIKSDNLYLEIFLHIASLIAIIIYNRNLIGDLLLGFISYTLFKNKRNEENLELFKKCIYLIIATIPLVIFSILFDEYIYIVSSSLLLIGLMLMINGLILRLCLKVKTYKNNITYKDAIVIGLFQCLGSFPGISRSGSCLCGGYFCKIEKEENVRFAFLLFIPVMLGAISKSLFDLNGSNLDYTLKFNYLYFISFITSFIFTLLSLKMMSKIVINNRLMIFSYYTFLLGLVICLWQVI